MLRIRLLGEMALEADGEPLEPPARRHGRLLLAYLALHPGLHGRGDLARVLWPDVLDSSARSSLRSALSSVRRALGGWAGQCLVSRRDRIGLADRADVVVDVREFRTAVEEGRLEHAATIGRATLLQGFDDDWVDAARRHHREQLGEILGTLAATAEADGDLERAIRFSQDAVDLDPLAEHPARELIRLLAAAGDRAAALAAYARLSDAFRTRLRAAPSQQTRDLVARVRAPGDAAEPEGWSPPPLQAALRSHAPSTLIGRAAELEVLHGALASARAGERGTVLIAGEPGIGKSALLANFGDNVAGGATVLLGRCGSGPAVAFAPLVDALRHYAAETPPARLALELPPVAGRLVGLVPELERAVEPPAPASDLELGESGRLARIIAEVLAGICAAHPLVLILDDLQAVDPASLEAVAHLVANSDAARLLVLIAYRDTEAAALQRALRRLRRLETTRSLVLGPLDEHDTGALASAATGTTLSPEHVAALHRHSAGNPLFIEELARRPGAAGELPERITDLILDELARLTPETRRVLATASALDDEVDLALLTRALGATVDACLDALDEAVAARIVHELPGRVGRYEFRHALIRDALYETLTATRRAHLHLRIAEALEAGEDRRALRAIAEHLHRARELVPASRLAEHTVRAARDAEDALAHEDAALLYERAAELAEHADERTELLLRLGRARRRAGQAEAARQAFREAASLAGRDGRPGPLADAALGLCGAPDFTAGAAVDGEAVGLLERAIAVVGEDDATRSRLLAQLAVEQYNGGDHELVSRLVGQAQELAHAGGDDAARGAAADAAHMIRRGGGDPRERLALGDELFEIARRQGDPERLVLAHVRRAADLFELGDFAGVRAQREALTALAHELRQPSYLWWTKLWEATQAIFQGAPDGEALARGAFAAGRTAVGAAAELELGAQTFWLRLEAGRLAEDGPVLHAALERYAGLPAARCALARIDAETGDRLARAAGTLRELTGEGLEGLRREAGWPISAVLLAEVCARVGDEHAAGRLAAALAPSGERWATSAFGSLCLGPMSAALALVHAVAGTWEQAEHWRDRALGQCADAGAGPAAARLSREYARLAPAPPPARANRTRGPARQSRAR